MNGVYIHIPFCRTHCTYCGFYSELLPCWRGSESVDAFLQALKKEISLSPAMGDISTLYVGGGTPSLLSPLQLGEIAGAVRAGDAMRSLRDYEEFTVEVNPDDIVKGGTEYAAGLREIGVNRISMGVQSFNDAVLKKMGRRHNAEDAFNAFRILRSCGLDNISIDLIFGFTANSDLAALRSELLAVEDLPEHISCYQLSIEEGSGLEKMVGRGLYTPPDDDKCADQYYGLCSLFADLGYEHYEISNWALPGRRSRHNSAYWNHTPYTGFGPGAHSLFVGTGSDGWQTFRRRWNNPDLKAYLAAAATDDFDSVRGQETLTVEQIREERIMLGLRTSDGIPATYLEGVSIPEGTLVPASVCGNLRIPESKWFVSDSIILDISKNLF